MAQSSTDAAEQLAGDRPIGLIEPVFHFYDAMPTGVTVAADGRIWIVFVSQSLTLYITPVYYVYIERARLWLVRRQSPKAVQVPA